MTDADRLRLAIQRSSLSARRYATTVLMRNERTVRRWLAGDSPIPEAVRATLPDPEETPALAPESSFNEINTT